MRKRKLVLSAFLAIIMMCLVVGAVTACDSGGTDKNPTLEGVTIANKVELTRDWYVGGLEREVKAAFAPNWFENTDFTVTSSSETVVSVSGHKIAPVSEGKSTITVTAGDKSDSVDVTVKPVFNGFTVTNKSDLSGRWYIDDRKTLEISYDPSDKYNAENMPVAISAESEVDGIFDINGLTLTAKKRGDAIINVSAGGKTESFEVRVLNNFVTLETSDPDYPTVHKILEGESISLPELVATAPDETDLTSEIEIEIDNSKLSLNGDKTVLTANEYGSVGNYTVKYTVEDPDNPELKDELTLNVSVYRNVINKDNDETIKSKTDYKSNAKYVSPEKQIITTTNGGNNVRNYIKFNMPASKLYYAEVTYDFPNYMDNSFQCGLAHYLSGNEKRSVASVVQYDGNFYIRDFDVATDSITNGDASDSFYYYDIANNRGLFTPMTGNKGHFTYATARVGKMFYYFINGNYIGAANYEYYSDKDTIPGIYGVKMVDWAEGAGEYWGAETISNIQYYNDETAVQSKLNKLLYDRDDGFGIISPYIYYSDYNTFKESKDNKVTDVEFNQDGSLSFTYNYKNAGYFHQTSISPNIFFEKDYTVEWDYKATDIKNNDAKYLFQVRHRKHDDPILQFGIAFNGTVSADFIYGYDAEVKLQDKDYDSMKNKFTTALSNIDVSQGVKFKLTAKYKESGDVDYTVLMQSKNTSSQKYEHTFSVKAAFAGTGNVFMWNNGYVFGEYSNVKWSDSVSQS